MIASQSFQLQGMGPKSMSDLPISLSVTATVTTLNEPDGQSDSNLPKKPQNAGSQSCQGRKNGENYKEIVEKIRIKKRHHILFGGILSLLMLWDNIKIMHNQHQLIKIDRVFSITTLEERNTE
ncbi:unnamed protein product [Dovyalis caffra]|uniref:Uncharacterized protein n=1 Tax=Dovyalis caffra TaxID=77055 RepID=A0AAV1RSE5_9ROSI|nr:unnamed protein product [Dovyalis caffra]